MRAFSGHGNRQRMERVSSLPTSYVIQKSSVEHVQQSPSSELVAGIKLIGSATKGAIKSVFGGNKETD